MLRSRGSETYIPNFRSHWMIYSSSLMPLGGLKVKVVALSATLSGLYQVISDTTEDCRDNVGLLTVLLLWWIPSSMFKLGPVGTLTVLVLNFCLIIGRGLSAAVIVLGLLTRDTAPDPCKTFCSWTHTSLKAGRWEGSNWTLHNYTDEHTL